MESKCYNLASGTRIPNFFLYFLMSAGILISTFLSLANSLPSPNTAHTEYKNKKEKMLLVLTKLVVDTRHNVEHKLRSFSVLPVLASPDVPLVSLLCLQPAGDCEAGGGVELEGEEGLQQAGRGGEQVEGQHLTVNIGQAQVHCLATQILYKPTLTNISSLIT